MKKRIVFGILIVVVVVLAACGSSPTPSRSYSSTTSTPRPSTPPKWADVKLSGENERMLEGTTWLRWVIGDARGMGEFRAGGVLVVWVINHPNPAYEGLRESYTWEREGNFIRIITGTGFSLYEGNYYPESQKIMLTELDSRGETDYETWELYAGSIVALTPPPQQAAPVYVQPAAPAPAAPAQTAPQQSAPATPTLRGGVYAYVNTNILMDINLTTYLVTAYVENRIIANGSCRISGDQLVLTFRTGSNEGAGLRGNTYAYTITSNTSFSGSGETWVYRGGIIIPSTR